MCLSTAYFNEISDQNAIMENVMHIECEDDKVILIDLMGRRTELEAKLIKASLTDGYVILKAN